ncbi:hypothetical protein [uncultured Mediterranean phage uvMED]|nr:hypothetical protein [uncultured Mediterranean phage uvMED]
MAIPSGSGTEVLKRVTQNGLNNTTTTALTVGTDKICTILSIVITDMSSGGTLRVEVSPLGSGSCFLAFAQTLPASGTFIFNDKFVLTATDVLKIQCTSTDHDFYISYIEQDWS